MAINENDAVKEPLMLKKSLFVLATLPTGFVFQGVLHFQPATIALFGACLGGNGTAIGASVNVIVVGTSEKLGKRISSGKFMLYGMPMIV